MNLKNILLVLIVSWVSHSNLAFAEKKLDILPTVDGEVMYQEVVDVSDKYPKSEIYKAVKRWAESANLHRKVGGEFSTAAFLIGGVKVAPEMGNIEASHLNRQTFVGESEGDYVSLKLYQHYQSKGVSMQVRTLFLDSDLNIEVKEGKYRYTLSDSQWEHWNHFNGSQQEIYAGKDGCGVRGDLQELQSVCPRVTGSRKKALAAIHADVQQFLTDMKNDISEELTNGSKKDDW